MIIARENTCQVSSDIFFVREELRNIDKQIWKSDIKLGVWWLLRSERESQSQSEGVFVLVRSVRLEKGKGFYGPSRGFCGAAS